MAGLSIHGLTYELTEVVLRRTGEAIGRWDVYQDSLKLRSHETQFKVSQAIASPVVAAYQALVTELGSATEVPSTIDAESFGVAEPTTEVMDLRRKYLDVTKSLCQYAGRTYTGKLSNVEYEATVLACIQNDIPAAMLTYLLNTLIYCCDALRSLEGQGWWDSIGDMQ